MLKFQDVLVVAVIALITYYVHFRYKRRRLYELAATVPGTKELPLLGILHKFIGVRNEGEDCVEDCSVKSGKMFCRCSEHHGRFVGKI